MNNRIENDCNIDWNQYEYAYTENELANELYNRYVSDSEIEESESKFSFDVTY